MSKETADLSPTPWQMIRSVRSYLGRLNVSLAGEISEVETKSGARYWLYESAKSAPADGFPLVVHLHGAAVGWSWVRRDIHWMAQAQEKAVTAGKSKPMVIVAPLDPTKFSMWVDGKSEVTNAATMVMKDILPDVESAHPIAKDRANRHVHGFSMGGFGAASLGLKYQQAFSTVTIMDGAMHDWGTITKSRPKIAATQFGDDEAYFDQWSPWQLVQQADLSKAQFFVVEGLMESFNRRFADHIRGLGGQAVSLSPNCLHDLRCLTQAHGEDAFTFMSGSLD